MCAVHKEWHTATRLKECMYVRQSLGKKEGKFLLEASRSEPISSFPQAPGPHWSTI